MIIKKRLKKLFTEFAVIGIVILIHAQSSFGQGIVERLIYRPSFISKEYRNRWYKPYENLGLYDYRLSQSPVDPVVYDQFGNYVLPGGEIYNIRWNRSRLGAQTFNNTDWTNSIFNNLMILSDEFSNWQTRFLISAGGRGDGIRTYFTPSTLKRTNFGGFRWDASNRKNSFTVVASPGGTPTYGVHWETKLGDILTVGATYVARQRGTQDYSNQDIDLLIRDEPRYIYVLITDDTPADEGPGARVSGVRGYLNGKRVPIVFKSEEYEGDDWIIRGRLVKIDNIFEQRRFYYGRFSDPVLDDDKNVIGYTPHYYLTTNSNTPHTVEGARGSQFSWILGRLNANVLRDLFYKTPGTVTGYTMITGDGTVTNGVPNGSGEPSPEDNLDVRRHFRADMSAGYLEAKGSDVIMYEFMVPYGTRKVDFELLVANDYCIDMVVAMTNYAQTGEGSWYDAPGSPGWVGHWNVRYDKKHVAKAEGNVKDLSNMEWVKVTYNRNTGMNVYGMNMEMNWKGLYLRAEYNENNTKWAYPINERYSGASRDEQTTRAWFVNAEKQLGSWSVGAELWNYPRDYMYYYSTVEDNDDDNRYVGGAEYPGLDFDYDLYIDTTWRGSPWLNYFYDSVTVGDDFNHRGGIDRRENDNVSDLPYDRDTQGQHYFIKYRPRLSTIITFGHYDIKGSYLEGRNFTRYFKIDHHQAVKGIGEYLFYQRIERIRDDLKPWHHNLTNNFQFTGTISTRLYFIPGLNIINNANFTTSYKIGEFALKEATDRELRNQFMGIYKGDDLIKRYGNYNYRLEHKIDYTLRIAEARILPQINIGKYRLMKEKRIKEFKLMPQLKILHYYSYRRPTNRTLGGDDIDRRPKSYYIYPILRFDYRVAPNTLLRFGMEGFPGIGLPQLSKRRGAGYNPLGDTESSRVIFAFENESLYQGFNLLVMAGVNYQKITYPHDPLKKDPGQTEYFIRLQSEASK